MTKPHEVADHEGVREEHRRADREREESRRGLGRLESFCDGVFAIAATLLVLNLDPPRLDLEGDALNDAIFDQIPEFFGFAISFWVITRFWVAHHSMFAYVKRYDGTFLFLNLLMLFIVAFVPFPTEIVGENTLERVPAVLYAVTIASLSLVSAGIWWYATHDRRLVARDLDKGFIREVQLRSSLGAIVFLASIPVAFVNLNATFVIWIAFFPVARIGVGRWQRRRQRRRDASDTPGASG